MGLTYKDAGVDIQAGDALVDRIKPLARSTHGPGVIGGLGGFAGLFAVPQGMNEPVLVSGTDGVGTKLKVAFALNRHDTVGQDLVAMCVNDILTVGARPLFFLDYFATGKLEVAQGEAVVRGIADGCRLAGCALLGGETAELPGFYQKGEYDLAGFAVGVVERSKILDGTRPEAGDRIIALPSSGLHSNGFSLARAALADRWQEDDELAASLLKPTRIYASAVAAALAAVDVRAMCHVTGGGLPGNLPRVLPEGTCARVSPPPPPAIFETIRSAGDVGEDEMRRTFNLGVGYVFVVAAGDADALMHALREAGETPFALGTIEASTTSRVEYA